MTGAFVDAVIPMSPHRQALERFGPMVVGPTRAHAARGPLRCPSRRSWDWPLVG